MADVIKKIKSSLKEISSQSDDSFDIIDRMMYELENEVKNEPQF